MVEKEVDPFQPDLVEKGPLPFQPDLVENEVDPLQPDLIEKGPLPLQPDMIYMFTQKILILIKLNHTCLASGAMKLLEIRTFSGTFLTTLPDTVSRAAQRKDSLDERSSPSPKLGGSNSIAILT